MAQLQARRQPLGDGQKHPNANAAHVLQRAKIDDQAMLAAVDQMDQPILHQAGRARVQPAAQRHGHHVRPACFQDLHS